jgi:hypothetical protein
LGQEKSPRNFLEDQTTPHDKPMARTKVEDHFDPVRTDQRRKTSGWATEQG